MKFQPCFTCGIQVDVDNPFGVVSLDETFCEEHMEDGIRNLENVRINNEIINNKKLDIFDQLIIIESWFDRFTDEQKRNIIDILEKQKDEKVNHE